RRAQVPGSDRACGGRAAIARARAAPDHGAPEAGRRDDVDTHGSGALGGDRDLQARVTRPATALRCADSEGAYRRHCARRRGSAGTPAVAALLQYDGGDGSHGYGDPAIHGEWRLVPIYSVRRSGILRNDEEVWIHIRVRDLRDLRLLHDG